MAYLKNPFKPFLQKLPAPVKNKYFITLVLFFAWMIFMDQRDFFTNIKLNRSLEQLEADKRYYENKLVEVKKDNQDVQRNKEKYAREHYYMKKDNEDVFIITKE